MATKQPLIIIVGPTASGKTALSVDIARRFNGEVIAADSRTVFRDMNIGTAKPTVEERKGIQHWGFDLASPGERYTAAAFKEYAVRAIADIRARGKVPIIAGGTGLYVDGVVFDFDYPDETNDESRNQFEAMTTERLYSYCVENAIPLPVNYKNRRHLLQAILQAGVQPSRRDSLIANTFMFGIAVSKTVLRTRISTRAEQMFKDGVVDEAKRLGDMYGWDNEAMRGNIYPLLRGYLVGGIPEAEVYEASRHRDWQLAKRQMTWFRRNPYISWGTSDDIARQITQLFTVE